MSSFFKVAEGSQTSHRVTGALAAQLTLLGTQHTLKWALGSATTVTRGLV